MTEVTPEQRITSALDYAANYAYIDGAHHKMWVIDQMVRALTGCPMIQKTGTDANGEAYTYPAQGESQEYLDWIDMPDAEDTGWDPGISP